MTAKDFLALLGSMVAHRLPGNTAHLQRLAPVIAERLPSRWFGTDLAERAAPHLLDRMKPDELLEVLRREGNTLPSSPMQASAMPREAVAETPEQRAKREEDEDRAWWLDRVATFAAAPDATYRWRHGMGMRAVLNRRGAHPRPYLAEPLADLIAQAEADGANTDAALIPMPAERRPVDLRAPPMHLRSRRVDAVPAASPFPAATRRISPAAQRRIAEDREDNRLRLMAAEGDENARLRLAYRQERRAQPFIDAQQPQEMAQ